MSKLTNTQIKNTKPKEKPYVLSDGLGLSLLVNPNGSKWWRYRFQYNRKAKMMSLGTYPDVSLANARKALSTARELVAQGIDPIEVKKEHRKDAVDMEEKTTLKTESVLWLDHIVQEVSTHHYKRSESLLRLYLLPELGTQPMENITHRQLQQVIVNLASSGRKESAKKLYGVIKKLWSYATVRNHIEMNVAKMIELEDTVDNTAKRKFPTITEPMQVKQLISNIKNFEDAHWSTKYALQFMALTSLRSSNIRNTRWEQIDLDNKLMTISKNEMKIDYRKRNEAEDFRLPLSTQAVTLLREAKRYSGKGKYVFPSIRGDRAMSENAMLVFIRSLGYTKEQFTPHGFRAMFATIANDEDNGFDRDLIDAQLAHKVGSEVSRTYNRGDYLERRKNLVQWWADWLDII